MNLKPIKRFLEKRKSSERWLTIANGDESTKIIFSKFDLMDMLDSLFIVNYKLSDSEIELVVRAQNYTGREINRIVARLVNSNVCL